MLDSRLISKTLVPFIGLVLAVVLGSQLVTDRGTALAWVGAGVILAMCLWLGKDIWLLIPFAVLLNIRFPWLPGAFPPSQLAVLLTFAWCLGLLALRKLPIQFRMTSLEFWGLMLLLTIVQVYARNPVGLAALGSDTIGARPYFSVAVAVIGGVILSSLIVTPAKIKQACNWLIAGGLFSIIVNIVPYLVPSLAPYTVRFFGAVGNYREYVQGYSDWSVTRDSKAAGRLLPATEFGILLSRWVASHVDPVRKLIHPFWGFMILTSICAAGYGGFRSGLASVVLNLGLGAFYWGRTRSAIVGLFAGIAILIVFSTVNVIYPLPPNIQRALSFLPGTWDKKIIEDAEGSTSWRVEMWIEALTTKKYIQNKILGDGLGFTARELKAQAMLQDMKHRGASGWDLHRESVFMTGDYHSGPVQTIRTTGYVGLVILLLAMSVVAWQAHKLILRSRGTPYMMIVCFFCIPMVWHPVFFTFVFGSFGNDVPLAFMNIGFLRLLQNNLPLGRPVVERVPEPRLPMAHERMREAMARRG